MARDRLYWARPVEGHHPQKTCRIRLSDQACFREVQSVDFVGFAGVQRGGAVVRPDRVKNDGCAHQLCDPLSLNLVKRFQHTNALCDN